MPSDVAASPGRVVVGVDPSRNAARAAEIVARFAVIVGVDVVLVHGRGLLEARTAGVPDWLGELAAGVRAGIDGSPAGRRTRITTQVVEGAPAEALLRMAAEPGTSAVVVGRTGAGSAVQRALGSTSAEVVARCPVPVVVIPEAPRPPPQTRFVPASSG